MYVFVNPIGLVVIGCNIQQFSDYWSETIAKKLVTKFIK